MTDTTTDKPAKIFAAIMQVKRHLAEEGVAKGRNNTQQGYSFRGIDDILNAMAAPLVNAGIIVVPRVNSRTERVDILKSSNGKDQRVTSVALDTDFLFVHAEDGSSLTARIQSEASDYADKATNKAISFALKYAFISVFNIPVVGADEGDFESPGNDAETQQPVAARPQAAPKAAAKKGAKAGNGKAPPITADDVQDNAIVLKLKTLGEAVAMKVAALIQKAYNVKSVGDVPADKINEAITRIDGFLKKQQATAAATKSKAAPAQAQHADEIPE